MNRFLSLVRAVLTRRRVVALLLLVVVVTGIVYGIIEKPDFFGRRNRNTVKNMNMNDISTVVLESREIRESVDTLGEIVFKEKVSISSKVNGRLAKIYASAGKRVSRGELIAEIERLPFEITLKQQKSELDIARRGLELSEAKYNDALKSVEIKLKTINKAKADLNDKRVTFENMEMILNNKRKLFEAGGISQTELESIKTQHTTLQTKYELARADYEIQQVGYRGQDIIAEGMKLPDNDKDKIAIFKKINTKIERAELESAKSRVRQAESSLLSTELLLKETYIRSPLNGVVAVKNMEAGEMVREDSVLATVIDISRVYISMNLNENEIKKISRGQRVKFTVDALSGKEFRGAVETITPLLDTKSRTIEVRAIVENAGRELLPGMFSRAVIDTGKNVRGLLIPAGAVVKREDGREEVYVVKNGIALMQTVATTGRHGEELVVGEGLKEGDRIVVKGINSVYQGMKLQ